MMYKNDQVVRRFSESFKLKILDELSTGKYSKRQLANIYGMGRSTINDWIRKYGRQYLMFKSDFPDALPLFSKKELWFYFSDNSFTNAFKSTPQKLPEVIKSRFLFSKLIAFNSSTILSESINTFKFG